MNYQHEERSVELSNEGETIQSYLLSGKYPRLGISLGQKTLWSKLWNWLSH